MAIEYKVTGVKNVGKSTKDDDEEFDSYLGMALGETWWQLGRNFAKVLGTSGESQQNHLEAWAAKIRQKLAEDDLSEPLAGVTPEAILAFVKTTMAILENKYQGRDVAREVKRLTKKIGDYNLYDAGQYLNYQEPVDVFWAVEYDFLFRNLDVSYKGGGWLNAVSRCEDSDCRAFFIKSRTDQRHHSDACRTRSANRRAYGERAGQAGHTKRGRPRLRR